MKINSDNKQRIHDVLISDLQRRLFKQYNERTDKRTDEDYDQQQSLLVNRVLHLDTLADVNDVLIEYGDLFPNEQVFTLEGTMNYMLRLLVERIENDAKIIHNLNLE
jgi:hypothetical protein